MIFEPAELPGVFRVAGDPQRDDRGYFLRTFDAAAFRERGLIAEFPEHSSAFNAKAGTLRGLHYQAPPYGETKIVRCVRGKAYDVLLDVRRESPTFGKWQAFELAAGEPLQLYVPEGIAHGYQTLVDETELHYLISAPYVPAAAEGVHYADPRANILWPYEISIISARDRRLPNLT